MKYIYIILICFLGIATQAQVQLQSRSNFPTVVDSSLKVGKNFIVPVFRSLSDLAKYQVLDSTGRLMFLRDSNALFVRNNAHQWVKLATSGGSSGGGWQLTGNAISSGEFFGTTNNQPLDVRADGVTLMLLDGNTKIVTIGDVNTAASGATFEVDATDNGSYNFNKPYFTISGVEYVFPSTQGSPFSVLTNNGNGVLQWAAPDTLPDRLISVGLSLVDSTLTITTPIFISGGQLDSIPGTFTYVIHAVDSGYIRQTLFYIDNGTVVDSLQGIADTANVTPPTLPLNGITITIVTQIGDAITPPLPAIANKFWSTDGLNFIPNTSPSVLGVANNRNVSLYQNSIKKIMLDSTGGVKFYDSLVMAEINPSVVGAMDSRTIKLRAKGSTGNLQEARIYVNGFGGSNGAALNFASDNGFMQFRATLPEFQFVGNARIGGGTGADFFVRSLTSGATVTNDFNQSSGNLFTIRKSNGAVYKSYMAMNFDGRVVLEDSVTSAPAASAIMDMRSTVKGFLKPRMTGVQMNAISSPSIGLEVYNTDSAATCYWNGSLWVRVGSGGGSSSPDTLVVLSPLYGNTAGDTLGINESSETQSGVATAAQVILWNNAALNTWKTDGNSGTDPSINFLGTTDNVPLYFRVNGDTSAIFGTNTGNASIGFSSVASGYGSIAIGYNATATGDLAVAIGSTGTASGDGSIVLGQNISTGLTSLATGNGTYANGNVSSSFGESTTANGYTSSSFGYGGFANGDYSMVIGRDNIANSKNSLVIGRYNDTTGQLTNDTSILFQIGNGYASLDETIPSNIMTVTYNGLGIGTTTPTARLHVVAPDTNVAKFVGLGNTVLATDSALVIDTDGNVKKAAKSSGAGVTTGQLTDSLNARGDTYKLKSDSTGNSGYTTLYQHNKTRDSLPIISSGTYTPTATIVANLDATPTLSVCQYLRVGNTVTVSGEITVDPTTASGTLTRARFTLPIASALTISAQCSGNANIGINGTAALGAAIKGDATNDQAEIAFGATYTSSLTYNFSFTYRVL